MIWNRIIAIVVALALIVSALALPRVSHVLNQEYGELLWNSNEAYVFVSVTQYGYSFSYLGFLVEIVRDVFPFGASAPDKKHYYTVVLHITPDAIRRYSVDNFQSSIPNPIGQTLFAGNNVGIGGPVKWSGTHFEPATAAEQKEIHDASENGKIPASPSYDNIGGWSKRMVAGDTSHVGIELDAQVTVQLGGQPMIFTMNSGYFDHEAFIELSRPGKPPERIWHLNERAVRVSNATYKEIFGND
jgi:hypothetical protein